MFRFFIVSTLLAASAAADPLPEPLQSQRDKWSAVSKRACDGDRDAFLELFPAAKEDRVGAALTSFAWLVAVDRCVDHGQRNGSLPPVDYATRTYKKAAEMGYPIAQSNYGVRLLLGMGELDRRPDEGIAYLQKAMDGGFGLAGIYLAEELLESDHPNRRSLIESSFNFAVKENVERARVALTLGRIWEQEWKTSGDQAHLEKALSGYETAQYDYKAARNKLDELRPYLPSAEDEDYYVDDTSPSGFDMDCLIGRGKCASGAIDYTGGQSIDDIRPTD